MPSYKTKSVILKSYNLGEADRIIKLFSQDSGIIDAIAKGSRKIKSKFGGRLELYNFVELELSRGRNLDIINQAEILANFKNIPKDFNKFLFCQLISEMILKTNLSGSENSSVIFKLIYACFNEIDEAGEGDVYSVEKIGVFFISKFLKITGYSPLISSCCRCGAKTGRQGDRFFSIKFGGLLCRSCSAQLENNFELKKPLSEEKLDFLSALFSIGLKDFKEVNISQENLEDIFRLIGSYTRYHTDCNIDMPLYLKKILR